MTETNTTPPNTSWRGTLRSLFSRRMLVVLLQGFSCGVPYLLTGALLQAWLVDECVSIEHVSMFGLVMLPYSLKFLWAPLLDRYAVPFFGRRRGWLFIIQIGLAISIAMVGQNDPLNNPWLLALSALILVFFAASQDIVIDAHRRECLSDRELAPGSSIHVQTFRIGMLMTSGFGLILADQVGFEMVYMIMGGLILVGVISTIIANEPIEVGERPHTLREAVIEPFKEFFQRRDAWLILLFVLLYKFGDALAGHLTTPFFLDYGFTKTEVGAVAKLMGFVATVIGAVIGAVIMLRIGLFRSLVFFGFLQMISTFGFAYMSIDLEQKKFDSLAKQEAKKAESEAKKKEREALLATLDDSKGIRRENCVPNSIRDKLASKEEKARKKEREQEDALAKARATKEGRYRILLLTIVITLENLAAGMGTAAFVAFMARVANKRFTATQYALLTSLFAISGNLMTAPAGHLVKAVGWEPFFLICTFVAIPGILLIWRFKSWIGKEEEPPPVQA